MGSVRVRTYTITEPELQEIRQHLYDAEDLALILSRLDEADFLNTDSPTAHVATLTPFIRQRVNQVVTVLNAIEARRRPSA